VRGDTWQGAFAGEPYEAGWAREAVIFVRLLKAAGRPRRRRGERRRSGGWHALGRGRLARPRPGACRRGRFRQGAHFGNWLRVSGRMPEGASGQALVTVHLEA
jgi:hypothetical protein